MDRVRKLVDGMALLQQIFALHNKASAEAYRVRGISNRNRAPAMQDGPSVPRLDHS
jgi:hypothetical protein